jgi:hypothetical protein
MPLRLLRILPASLIESGSLNFLGGAKSSEVNVPDLRSMCLFRLLDWTTRKVIGIHLRARHRGKIIKGTGDRGKSWDCWRVRPSLTQRALGSTSNTVSVGFGRSKVHRVDGK